MPIFDFKCTVCGHVQEELLKVSEVGKTKEALCAVCGSISEIQISAPAGIAGNAADGYKHRSGSTGVWKEDMGPNGKRGREWYGDNPHAPSTLASAKTKI